MRTYGPPQKNISSRHEALGIWTDLQLSKLYHEVQEGSQNTWRKLSKQDGSVQPWAPRSIILILKHTPASALFLWLFVIFPPFCFFSDNSCCLSPILLLHPCLLCRSRERNGENNALFQEEAALNFQIMVSIGVVNLQITVSIGVVNLQITVSIGVINFQVTVSIGAGSKVGFHSVEGLYPGPHGHKGYRRDQSWQNHFPSPDSIINRSVEAHHPLWFPGVSEELAGCCCPSTGAIACSGGWLRPGQVEVLAPGSRGTLPWCHTLCTSSSASDGSPVTPWDTCPW